MKIQDRIIVLNSTPFSEKSLVLHCLSRKWGRRSFLVSNASRLMPFFQPLNILDCDVAENQKSRLYRVSSFVNVAPLAGIRSSYGKNAISMFISEVLYRALREDMSEPDLFAWCQEEILLLDALQADYANFHIRFLLDFAAAMGFSPSYEALLPFLDDNAALAGEFLRRDAADSMLIPISGARRSDLCVRLLKYLEYHLEFPLKIRSLAVLQEVQ